MARRKTQADDAACRVTARKRTAYHESGHAVLSAAINDAPRLVSIKRNAGSLGRTQQQMNGRPEVLVQVHLAGLAAEHLLTNARPSKLKNGPHFAIQSLITPGLAHLGQEMHLDTTDEYMAVEQILAMGCARETEAITAEVERFYEAARASLEVLWPQVERVAKAVLKHDELDRQLFFEALGDDDIYTAVSSVQEAHGMRERR